ncbi:MAG: hypothetical protein J7L77_00300 [Clostridiales bacterium]|nr:hypothetical protein [Clostridiales bacterium]
MRELGESLTVGNNSGFGDYNFIGVRGSIEIGNDVLFGPRVSIHAENHLYEKFKKRLIGQSLKASILLSVP